MKRFIITMPDRLYEKFMIHCKEQEEKRSGIISDLVKRLLEEERKKDERNTVREN